jgi:hypothetical protein
VRRTCSSTGRPGNRIPEVKESSLQYRQPPVPRVPSRFGQSNPPSTLIRTAGPPSLFLRYEA